MQRSAVLVGKGAVEVRDTPLPGVPLPGHLQVAIGAVGICGSDLAYFAQGRAGGILDIDFEKSLTEGYMGILGHEAAGTVVAVGEGVDGFVAGDRVALEAGVSCLRCAQCRAGRYNLCPSVSFLGSYVNRTPGVLTQVANHSAVFCHKLPAGMSLEQGCMVEPLSVALSGVKRGGVTVGASVLITGAGPVGLLTLLACLAAGATTVVVADVVDSKLALATELGAHAVVDSMAAPDAVKAAVMAATDGKGADVAIECSGATPALHAAIDSTAPGGVVVVVANQKASETTIPLQQLCRREIDLRGVYRYCHSYPTAISLLATGKVDVSRLVTHRFGLEETQAAFEAFKGDAIKIVITPPGME